MRDWLVKYWLTALFGAVTGGLGAVVKHIWGRQKCQTARQEAVEEGLRGLLHDRIYQACIDCQRKGYADVQDRKNLELLYNPYHALGGNGTGTDLYNMVRDLPATPPVEN